jgi:hypothetical protein
VNRPHRLTSTRAAWSLDGRLLALVADGEPDPLAFLDVPEGQSPLTSEQIAEHVATLDADGLAALVEAARAEAEGIDPGTVTSEDVDRINLLGDAVEAAEARQATIAQEEQERQENAQRALDRLRRPAEGEDGGEGGEGSDGEGSEGDGEGAGAEGEHAPEAVAASAPARRLGRRTTALPGPGTAGGMGAGTGTPGTRPPSGFVAPRAQVAIVAAAGLESIGLNAGTPIESRDQLGHAFGVRLDAIRRGRGSGADGEQVTVATIRTEYPADRVLRANSVDSNTTNVREATSHEALVAAGQHYAQGGALVAAGGLCAPIEQLYDVPVLGSTARPVRDALANFGADRGGVRWREHLSFGDFAGAVSFWTLDMDTAQGDPNVADPAPKPCMRVECPDEAEAYVEAITLCLQFSNTSARFDPEGTAANIAAAHRRESAPRAARRTVDDGHGRGGRRHDSRPADVPRSAPRAVPVVLPTRRRDRDPLCPPVLGRVRDPRRPHPVVRRRNALRGRAADDQLVVPASGRERRVHPRRSGRDGRRCGD